MNGRTSPRPARRLMSTRLAAAGVALLALAAAVGAVSAPASAEVRSVASFHFVFGAAGFDLERETRGGQSWLVGASLAPVGLYGGVRQYSPSGASDRAFWTVYGSVTTPSGPVRPETLRPGIWAGLGYEIRLDPRVRGTGEVGFGLVASHGELWPEVFIGLALGWKLPQ
ncbi:MAG: hypothetical protein AB1609_07070 [Bacillota bacterium]